MPDTPCAAKSSSILRNSPDFATSWTIERIVTIWKSCRVERGRDNRPLACQALTGGWSESGCVRYALAVSGAFFANSSGDIVSASFALGISSEYGIAGSRRITDASQTAFSEEPDRRAAKINSSRCRRFALVRRRLRNGTTFWEDYPVPSSVFDLAAAACRYKYRHFRGRSLHNIGGIDHVPIAAR